MSFVDRTYPDIVRDVLTNLTQGVSGERHLVTYDASARPVVVPDIVLKRRPVRRVSVVEGFIAAAPGAELQPYTFSLNDYELVPDQDAEDLSRIRFLPFGKKAASGTYVSVNYYPRSTDPTPLTDLNVGSVVRTVLEAVSRELAVLYGELNLAYDSAFLETATGSSLDRVVALLGYRRFRAGRSIGSVTFTRRAGSTGNITIPAGTPITDTADKIRYETVETRSMLAGESTAEVAVRGAAESTEPVAESVLSVIQRAIAGLDGVTNERPTTRASDDEKDVELRARARDALIASNKGTVPALEHGLLQLPNVRAVKVIEMPNGVPGEISLAISLSQPPANGALPESVRDRIEELRPAGIRVVAAAAGSVSLQASVALTLAGSSASPSELAAIHRRVQQTLVAETGKRGVGEKIRNRPLVAALLADERIVDAALTLSVKGAAAGAAGADFQPESGAAVALALDDVTFASAVFDAAAPSDELVAVDVRAVLRLTLSAGVSPDAVRSDLSGRLAALFQNAAPGTSVDAAAVLIALRNDAQYAIDPLSLRVTLSSGDQFSQILQGGPGFQVLPGQTFNVSSVESSSG